MHAKIATIVVLLGTLPLMGGTPAVIRVDASKPGAAIPASLWGIFFEDINHAGEGGLYGELIQNRSFEETVPPPGSTVIDGRCIFPDLPNYTGNLMRRKGGKPYEREWKFESPYPAWNLDVAGGEATIAIASANPLNSAQSQYLTLSVKSAPSDSTIRLCNSGFWGVPARKGQAYRASFWARARQFQGAATLGLLSAEGKIIGSAELTGLTAAAWTKYTATFTADATDGKARFFFQPHATGEIDLDVVSLFGPTYQDRPNGLRPDLVEKLKALKPAFMRFPGGCVVNGKSMVNAYRWKPTLGPIETRPGRSGGGYRHTDGLGYHEYLQLCEDLGAEAMYVVNVGLSCDHANGDAAPESQVPDLIQDNLDAVEYALGSADSTWGAVRAAAGHPAPFRLKYIELGNEDSGPLYRARYDRFRRALSAKYPQLVFILNYWGHADDSQVSEPFELFDEHYYGPPERFFAMHRQHDTAPRNRPYRVYVGEYGCTKNVGSGNHLAALSEAAFMLGLERNSDVVTLASYAPLFFNVNNIEWPVNMIGFDNLTSFGRSSYWVQQMFSTNRPDINLTTTLDLPGKNPPRIYAQAGLDRTRNEIVVKTVNATDAPIPTTLTLNGISSIADQASVITLSGDPAAENSVANPTLIVPKSSTIPAGKTTLPLTLDPWSVTVFRFPIKQSPAPVTE